MYSISTKYFTLYIKFILYYLLYILQDLNIRSSIVLLPLTQAHVGPSSLVGNNQVVVQQRVVRHLWLYNFWTLSLELKFLLKQEVAATQISILHSPALRQWFGDILLILDVT